MTEAGTAAHSVIGLVFAEGDTEAWDLSLRSLAAGGLHPLVVVSSSPATRAVAAAQGAEAHEPGPVGAVVRRLYQRFGTSVAVVVAPCLVPPVLAARASSIVTEHPGTAAISFVSNEAGYLSVPWRNVQSQHQIEDLDEIAIQRRLETWAPAPEVLPIPVAAGPVVVLGGPALGGLDITDDCPYGAPAFLADLSLRAQRRGLRTVVDNGVFVSRPWDLADPVPDPIFTDGPSQWLAARHPFLAQVHDEERLGHASATACALGPVIAKIRGLRVLVDGTCLGPKEMGTQVQTLALIGSLAARKDVRAVCVALPGPVHRYAEDVFRHPKVSFTISPAADFSTVERGDVVHRPFQPDRRLPFDQWEQVASRTVLTLQDVIAYAIGSYHGGGAEWSRYRSELRDGAARADGLVVISEDTRRSVLDAKLPVEAGRLFVVPNGTDHLRGDEPAALPEELTARGFSPARPFLLVLGTNYSHKNRDLAVAAWKLLRERRLPHALVLVGASVPRGSSRREEARRAGWDDEQSLHALADVSSEERNWLLRHADVVLYPTGAEGFGLVPFEAAAFGTPTVAVRFGPLAEVAGDVPVHASSWSPAALADAVTQLLDDPVLAAQQVAAQRKAGDRYRWSDTAARLTDAYRTLLALPTARR